MMPRTFEERVDEELDGLYAGALFLSHDDPAAAESLLVGSVVAAARRWAHQPARPDLGRRLRAELARAALRPGDAGLGSHPARVALWLVAVERWSYADAAAVLGVERDVLRGLLSEQRAFMRDLWDRRGRPDVVGGVG
ncbi:MAG: hypothetical protein RJQ04_14390 [Longimicrobiales bacterium]